MPPKKRMVEPRAEIEVETVAERGERDDRVGDDIEFEGHSPPASSYSSRSCGSLSAEQLERILAANTKSMMALLERRAVSPSHSSTDMEGGRPLLTRVDIPKWTEGESPSDFFGKYEQALSHNGVERSKWGSLLQVYISGSAQASFRQLNPAVLADYDQVKKEMLESLGDTPDGADKRWFSLNRQKGENHRALFRRVHNTGFRRMDGLETKEACCNKMILSKFLTLLSPDCYASVTAKKPANGQEAARFAQEFEEDVSFARSLQSKAHGGYYNSYRRENSSRVEQQASVGSTNGPRNGASGQVSNNSPSSVQGQNVGSNQLNVKSYNKDKSFKKERKPIVCYGCGEPDHIRPNCPNRIRRVKSPVLGAVMIVKGCLAGKDVENLRVDTGAERTVVRKDLVPSSAYIGETVKLDSWRGAQCTEHDLAKILIKVGSVEVLSTVAVVEKLDCDALLGSDLGKTMTRELMKLVVPKLDEEEGEPVRVTRAQARKEAARENEDDMISAQAECKPTTLSEIFDFPDSYFEQDPVPISVDELEEWPVFDDDHLPLPSLRVAGSDCLAKEQKEDDSLKAVLLLGVKGEKGYAFEKGVLVQYTSDGVDESVQRVIVPVGRRLQVLQLAHGGMTAGHFGVKKTFARLSRHFLWPGMWSQVKGFVRTCSGCQKGARLVNAKAPLQPLPSVSEPFQKVAFDIVGPLPRTTSGYKYLLTAMCLYTKFPEAIPLKRIDNLSVLNAMMEIFSRYGMPKELLTDQGSVFTSSLTRHMCKTFEVHKIRTSPYHPQSDGALERWHACLKGMLKKAEVNLKDWDQQLKYILFAYRDTPHCVTGFSPFSLMFGRDVKGPLEFLKSSWVEGREDDSSVGEWLINVRAKMCEMAEVVSDREAKAKAKMKQYYDKSASVKSFVEGEMVLRRKPVLKGKMGSFWEGPYEVEKKVSPVTYLVRLPGSANKARVLHCNVLKKWHTPTDRVHNVVVIGEDESECESSLGLKLVREGFVPSSIEQQLLDDVLDRYRDVLSDKPGRTEAAELCIRTGDSIPVRSHPYRIPPMWKEDVKKQMDQLLELGIIRPSTSPWSSSVVLAHKKDGGVRPCIDFRAVNAVTEPDPYQMPLIEEILDSFASARFISKIDLTKGFHQIPVKAEDCAKTAFCTPWGKFEFCYMPFGLRNGPAVFQRLMDNLQHCDKEFAQVYIDDIAVFSSTWEEHCSQIEVILSRLKEAGLTANKKKCMWGQTKVESLDMWLVVVK